MISHSPLEKVSYLGHSQGTSVMFALLSDPSLGPKYSKRIEPFIALSPVTRIGNAATLYRYVAWVVYHFKSRDIEGPFGHKEGIIPQFKSFLCNSPISRILCMWFLYRQMGTS